MSDFTFTFHFHVLEKEMATHSSVLAWKIPGTGEPGGLLSMGSHRVGHDWSDLAAVAAAVSQGDCCLLPGGDMWVAWTAPFLIDWRHGWEAWWTVTAEWLMHWNSFLKISFPAGFRKGFSSPLTYQMPGQRGWKTIINEIAQSCDRVAPGPGKV